jgi:hypothetical protein
MIVGTAYFTSRAAAVRYYQDYHYPDTAATVDRKIAEGEIHIGIPPHKLGARVVVIDDGTRYAIEEG